MALFSAKITKNIINLTKDLMIDPKMIEDKSKNLTLERISHYYIAVEKEEFKM